jgi:hypothetical protein
MQDVINEIDFRAVPEDVKSSTAEVKIPHYRTEFSIRNKEIAAYQQ